MQSKSPFHPILYDEERIDLEERAISENDLFCHSFFERLYDNAPDSCKIMLDTQFRMPAVIGTGISKLFYGGRLKNENGTENRAPVLFNSNLTFINYDGDRSYHENKNAYKQISNFFTGRRKHVYGRAGKEKRRDVVFDFFLAFFFS